MKDERKVCADVLRSPRTRVNCPVLQAGATESTAEVTGRGGQSDPSTPVGGKWSE